MKEEEEEEEKDDEDVAEKGSEAHASTFSIGTLNRLAVSSRNSLKGVLSVKKNVSSSSSPSTYEYKIRFKGCAAAKAPGGSIRLCRWFCASVYSDGVLISIVDAKLIQ